MTVKKQVLTLKLEKDQTKEEAITEFNSKSEFLSTAVKESFDIGLGDDFDFQANMKVLERATKQIKLGDLSKIEEMYISQAMALEVIFASLARRAKAQDKLLQYETHMRLALKAQNQSRATLQALVQLKQPANTQFIKQANIAQGHQQVNNLSEKNISPQNKLLEGETYDLDGRPQTTAARINSNMEAVGEVHRGKDSRRQVKGI
jgi:hypothetical protein